MSKQCLDVFNVNTTLKQVAGKTVTAAMTGNMLGYASPGGTLFEVLIDAVLIKVSAGPGTGEKNSSGFTTLKPVVCKKNLDLLTDYWFKCGRPTGILFPSSWTGDYLDITSVNQFFKAKLSRSAIDIPT